MRIQLGDGTVYDVMDGHTLSPNPAYARRMKSRHHHAGCCGTNPTRPDGTEWTHVMALHDGSMVHADTSTEVLDELIPGYARLDEAGRRTARIGHAERLAQTAQEARIATAAAAGDLDPTEPDAAGLLVLLRAARSVPIVLETEEAPGDPAPWFGPTLILVTTTYAPHTDAAPIGGNVSWLDPDSEASYLGSLREAGLFSYWTH